MTTIIYFDLCALVLSMVIMFSIIFRKMTKGVPNKLFALLVTVIFVDTVFDVWAVALDTSANVESFSLAVRYISHTGYLMFKVLTIPVYTLYTISLTDTWHKLKKRAILKGIMVLPAAVMITLLAANFFTKDMFYIDENFKYTRGRLFILMYVCVIIYFILGMGYLFKYHKIVHTGSLVAVSCIYPSMIIAVVIQFFKPAWLVEMFCSSIALMLIMITVQRPEELLDSGTGLGKYEAYTETMKRNFANEKHVGVIIINISNFASLNSILGYDLITGLLKKIAVELNRVDREAKTHADLFYLDRGRFRFVINESNNDKIDDAAEKINSLLKENIIFNQLELNLIGYVCVVYCPKDISDFKSLMSFGNELCSSVPFSGHVLSAAEILSHKNYYLSGEIDNIIDDALANHKFTVYYQPIYSTEKKQFVSAEALLRLNDEKYGFISPEFIVTAAEKSGAIHRLGEYVLEEVCRFMSRDGFDEMGLEYIEINLSVAQCMQSDLAEKLLKIINRHGVSPQKINLEITETAASYAQNIMMENLERLVCAGITFSLDDYGTGYSNIKSVASLPVTIVKLDKTFIDEEDNPRMWLVLKNTIKMLKDLDMSIVVEGIENAELAQSLADLNCDYIQGYYYSKPVSENEFIEFMTAQTV